MHDLTLCQSDTGRWRIQETDESDSLVSLTTLSGDRYASRGHWTATPHTEPVEPGDTDDWWRFVDQSIAWIAANRTRTAAWEACRDAYAGILTASDLADHFRRLMADEG